MDFEEENNDSQDEKDILRHMVVFARKTFFRYGIEYNFKENESSSAYVSRYIPAEKKLEVEATTEIEAAPTLLYHSILITLLEQYEPSASVAVASQAYIMTLTGSDRDRAIQQAMKVISAGKDSIGPEEVLEMVEYLQEELD